MKSKALAIQLGYIPLSNWSFKRLKIKHETAYDIMYQQNYICNNFAR